MLSADKITYFYLIKKAWPIILANASVPLLGLVDTAVIGNLGSTMDLGAIAFGSLIFSFVYWSFGFLRMGTTGFVAQAQGANDKNEVRAILGRSLLLSGALGVVIIILQWPLGAIAFSLLDGSEPVEAVAASYFSLRIWGAPATLSIFVLMGVLVGLGESGKLLKLQLLLNGLNIIFDVVFAGVLAWGARGIALGTLLAEWITVIYSIVVVVEMLKLNKARGESFWDKKTLFDPRALRSMLTSNSHIMVRTLVLIFSFSFFTNQSAQYGDITLAANHILLQLISFAAFFLDGYAFVIESMVGIAKGAKRKAEFIITVRKSSELALVTALLLALLIYFVGPTAVSLLTDIGEVRMEANNYILLAAIYVALSFAAFQLDGIFIGVSYTRQMRDASLLSISVFLLAWWLLVGPFGVKGLWWAMIIYVVARAFALMIFYPSLLKSLEQNSAHS